ncbi:polyamine ABC transporter ATP-binding protein [Falsochrobactrum shanghaiense]|uniref:Polyamine ABC transporter ATP-binding protein n=1 Tax=Falsochrobactrum shanghaiense TaxID=2201899 RepID=A0A316JCC5_9HYPH|nr:ABC transporter ATP-binding protein [Falsochrobactrum shanghaiense]PWL18325.1 polyamine ABC transporter ATP-binding protein [Falsochrobactrum shanghaiense]
MTALRLENVRKDFGSFSAVDGINLELAEGELVALLGPSGCGKTTTLRMIGGLEHPTDGKIVLGNSVIASRGDSVPPERRDMGMVFQSYALWPHMTVTDNIAYGLRKRNVSNDDITRRVREMLSFVEMVGFEKRLPSELSGGQQQRVSVARALATQPRIVLFDEPLSNLDATLRETMRFELRRIHQRSALTGIYVTHSQEEAFALGDRVAVMRNGRIEQIAAPTELYERPANEFVAQFVGLANLFEAQVEKINEKTASVKLSSGRSLTATLLTEAKVGQTVRIMIRPENLHLCTSEAVADDIFIGRVTDVVFSGAQIDFFVDTPDGLIRVQKLGGPRPSSDETVRLRVQKEHVMVIGIL